MRSGLLAAAVLVLHNPAVARAFSYGMTQLPRACTPVRALPSPPGPRPRPSAGGPPGLCRRLTAGGRGSTTARAGGVRLALAGPLSRCLMAADSGGIHDSPGDVS